MQMDLPVSGFLDLVTDTVVSQAWVQASKHYLGRGSQLGVDMDITAALYKSWKAGLAKDSPTITPTFVSLLEIVLTGGMWHPTRVAQTAKARQ